MWIDTAGTLPAGSQLTVLPDMPDYHASSHIDTRLHSPGPTNAGPDLLRHLRLHRAEAKYIHSPHPRIDVRDQHLSRRFLNAVTSPD
ncbi:hypothetical protein BASA62_001131 [Batrachochytrium salamandrivorans]|nr:hypothetical protein BASA62_001131 [Batrachochytrium salamandrivorans]